MSVDRDTVLKVARLARVRIDEARAEGLAGELGQILHWIDKLDEVDCEGVEPMTSAVERSLKLREDVVTDGGCPEAVLANAPEAEEGFFAVPKVVE